MRDIKISKLENPARMAELNPNNTLIKAGFIDERNLCDVGAGAGICIIYYYYSIFFVRMN